MKQAIKDFREAVLKNPIFWISLVALMLAYLFSVNYVDLGKCVPIKEAFGRC